MEKEKLIRLVTGAQNGDGAAMDQLFAAFYNDVYYFALKTVKDPDIACDITQETFLEIINTIGNLKEPAAFVTWMKQITYHQCTRYFKKRKDVLVEEDEDGNSIFDTLVDESEDSVPSEVYEKEEFRKTILAIIDELTEQQRSAVMLYYFDELSVSQIAGIQGVSEGTVKSRLNYARKAIKNSVEEYEKKNNIKLHSFSFLPLLMLFFGRDTMPVEKAEAIRAAVTKAAGALGSASAGVAGAATAGTGFAAKLAAMPIVTKILAALIAAALVIGGGIALLPDHSAHDCLDQNEDGICDACEATLRQEETEPDTAAESTERPEHYDLDTPDGIDGRCDHCGKPMCVLGMATMHWDKNKDCACDECGYVEHFHGQGSDCGHCDTCNKVLGILDRDSDGICDLCGEGPCGRIHPHADENGDKKCDFCAEFMCGFWMGEHNVNYDDGIYDEKCDDCGNSTAAIGWYDEEPNAHVDGNGDGICEHCKKTWCGIYGKPEFGGVDEDGDEKCDICKLFLCDGHGTQVYHYDFDRDRKCDRCDHYICAHGYLPHTDENEDGRCDNCSAIA